MPTNNQSPGKPKPNGDNFRTKLSTDPVKAEEIIEILRGRVKGLVIKKLSQMSLNVEDDLINEIVNRTFLVVYANFSKGKELDFSNPPDSLQSYFWRVAENICLRIRDVKIKEGKRIISLSAQNSEGLETQYTSSTANPEKSYEDKEINRIQRECYRQSLEKLKMRNLEKYDLLITYTNSEGMSSKEMKQFRDDLAEKLDIEPSYLTVLIHRIREKVRSDHQKCLVSKGIEKFQK